LHKVGIDFQDVVDKLKEQGPASLAKSWDELIASVTSQLEKAGAEVTTAGAALRTSRVIGAGQQLFRSVGYD
jgi:hypothetical protein